MGESLKRYVDILEDKNDSKEGKTFYKQPEKSPLPLTYTAMVLGLCF